MAPTNPNETTQTTLDGFLSSNDTDTPWQVAGGKKKRKATESPGSPNNDTDVARVRGKRQTNPVLITNKFQALSNDVTSTPKNDDATQASTDDANGQPNESNANTLKKPRPLLFISTTLLKCRVS